jgi:hypothetical protein
MDNEVLMIGVREVFGVTLSEGRDCAEAKRGSFTLPEDRRIAMPMVTVLPRGMCVTISASFTNNESAAATSLLLLLLPT